MKNTNFSLNSFLFVKPHKMHIQKIRNVVKFPREKKVLSLDNYKIIYLIFSTPPPKTAFLGGRTITMTFSRMLPDVAKPFINGVTQFPQKIRPNPSPITMSSYCETINSNNKNIQQTPLLPIATMFSPKSKISDPLGDVICEWSIMRYGTCGSAYGSICVGPILWWLQQIKSWNPEERNFHTRHIGVHWIWQFCFFCCYCQFYIVDDERHVLVCVAFCNFLRHRCKNAMRC